MRIVPTDLTVKCSGSASFSFSLKVECKKFYLSIIASAPHSGLPLNQVLVRQ